MMSRGAPVADVHAPGRTACMSGYEQVAEAPGLRVHLLLPGTARAICGQLPRRCGGWQTSWTEPAGRRCGRCAHIAALADQRQEQERAMRNHKRKGYRGSRKRP